MDSRRLKLSSLIVFFALVFLAGCGSEERLVDQGSDCPNGEREDPITGECVLEDDRSYDAGDAVTDSSPGDTDGNSDGSNDAGPDTGGDASDASDRSDTGSDTGDDTTEDTGPDVSCPDRDEDGFADLACGGEDCDDDDPSVYPGASEYCSNKDNDCSGEVNDGIECTFYAHSNNDLYEIDPFEKSADHITSVPSLVDIDTHPDKTLYGISFSHLFEYDDASGSWNEIGPLNNGSTPNGLAIDNEGTAFLTASNELYTVDLDTGAATAVGSMGGSFISSGDCVVNKHNTLYMSSSHSTGEDTLVLIDRQTGSAQSVGGIGYERVYGLTAGWGTLYGLTDHGELIEIDEQNGQGSKIHTFSNISWYGAASTPNR